MFFICEAESLFLINLAEMLLMLTLSIHSSVSPRDRLEVHSGLSLQITNNHIVMSLCCLFASSSAVDYQSNMDGNGKCLRRGDDNNRMCKYELILQHHHRGTTFRANKPTDSWFCLSSSLPFFLSPLRPVIIICSTSSSNQH